MLWVPTRPRDPESQPGQSRPMPRAHLCSPHCAQACATCRTGNWARDPRSPRLCFLSDPSGCTQLPRSVAALLVRGTSTPLGTPDRGLPWEECEAGWVGPLLPQSLN